MKRTSLIALTIIASQFTGCSKRAATSASARPAKAKVVAQDSQSVPKTVANKAKTNAPAVVPPAPKKNFEDMTAIEVAQDPASYGFTKGGSMVTKLTAAGIAAGMKPSRDDQWTEKTPDGKLYILTIHYEDGKIVYARWGGFNP